MILTQFKYYLGDLKRNTGGQWYRYFYAWFSPGMIALLYYRIERGFYLILGKPFDWIHPLLLPLNWLVQMFTHCDIHYKAKIGPGVLIMHTVHGLVISGFAEIGSNLTLVGGNVIGERKAITHGDLKLGNGVFMGMLSQILGPLDVGDKARIAAGAVITKNVASNTTAF